MDPFEISLNAHLESLASRYAAQIIDSQSVEMQPDSGFTSVELDSVQVNRPRSIGVGNIALQAAEQLELASKLRSLGFSRHQE